MMFPKNPRLENPHLLLMARREPVRCMLDIPGVCTHGDSLTACCACHGNGSEWNKGRGMKAHDFFGIQGCSRAHTWLDASYSASGEERDRAFRIGLARQITAWAAIARTITAKPKDVEATRWALGHLIERGYALSHPRLYAIPIQKD